MDYVVYVDAKAKELEMLLKGRKTMIIRGSTGRKLPYGRVFEGDILYLIRNNAEGKVLAKCKVKSVYNSDKMTEVESIELINSKQHKLNLTDAQYKKWAGKRYLVLIEADEVVCIEPFAIDKSNYGNMDDWLLVEDVNEVIAYTGTGISKQVEF